MPERPDRERLEQVEEHIDEARRRAERDVPTVGEDEGLFTDTKPAFHESGATKEEDDQTIVPPG